MSVAPSKVVRTMTDQPLSPRIHLHRAVRSSQLIDGLAQLLADEPMDPFRSEVVSVPTPGVERWLSQALSMRLGVTAGIDFVPFGPWLTQVWTDASADLLPADGKDPWRPDALTWAVLRAIDTHTDQGWAEPVTRHLSGSLPGAGRRFVTAARIAGHFHRYSRQRPEMVLAWWAGDDVDGSGQPLTHRHQWQAHIWRAVRSSLGVPSPAERIEQVTAVLRDQPATVDLPERISVFGLNRLDRLDRAMLDALALHHQIHLWLAHPSPARWQAQIGQHSELWPARTVGPHRPGGSTVLDRLGREVNEFHHVVSHLDAELVDTALDQPELPDTVLGQVQQMILDDLAAPPAPGRLDPEDRSIQIHSCHGADRQVEVLREVICGLLEDRPELEPRDIIIMCPDLPRFAPLVAASFDALGTGTADHRSHPGRRIRIRIADQSLSEVNPILAVLERLLELARARITASTLVDLCGRAPVAARFRFDTDDVETIEALVTDSGIRWGLDVEDRARYGLAGFGQNTVQAGLDRMVLGVALDETGHDHVGLVLPLDRVDSSSVDLVGRLVELVDRLRSVLADLARPHSLAGWVEVLHRAIDLLVAAEPGEDWQRSHAWATIQAVAEGIDDDTELDLGDIRAVLGASLQGRPTRANFRTGSLTLSSLAPMRSVPHRVICLLGMDDQAFPRGQGLDGDDILAQDRRIGDRDRRGEDRQLLLDALMAAEDTVVIIHSGKDPRTNASQPAAVPVGTVQDAVAALVAPEQRPQAMAQLVTHHSLQPYAASNFRAGTPIQSFDHGAAAAARVATRPRTPAPPVFSPTPLGPPAPQPVVGLDELTQFFKHPAKAYLRGRAGLSLLKAADATDDDRDALPLELDHLTQWQIGSRILAGRLDGVEPSALVDAEWRRGDLPPRKLGATAFDAILRNVDPLIDSVKPWLSQPRRQVDLLAQGEHGDGSSWSVTGTATRVHGNHVVAVNYSRLSPVHWLEAWWPLLALTITEPDQEWGAVAIGRGSQPVILGPVTPTFARTVLGDALELRRLGLTGPLPLPPKTAGSYAWHRAKGKSPEVAWGWSPKLREYETDHVWELFHGDKFSRLRDTPADPAEHRGPDAELETSRFQSLARRLFHPLILRAQGLHT